MKPHLILVILLFYRRCGADPQRTVQHETEKKENESS